MSTRIVMSNGSSLGDVLSQNLKRADTFLVATAYLSATGLDHVRSSLERILDARGEVNVIHGFYPQITETEAIRNLAQLADGSNQMRYGVYVDTEHSLVGSFHPKMYLTHSKGDDWQAVIGSSNLTNGGLRSNLEVNCTLTGPMTEPVIRQCRKVFDKIESDPNIHRPTIDWIMAYDRIRHLELENRRRIQRETEEAYELLKNLNQTESWVPETRVDCVVKALQNLENIVGRGSFHHLDEITLEAKRIAGDRYARTHWGAGVRQSLNRNTIYLEGNSKQLFERQDGASGNSGRYCLSENGRRYRG